MRSLQCTNYTYIVAPDRLAVCVTVKTDAYTDTYVVTSLIVDESCEKDEAFVNVYQYDNILADLEKFGIAKDINQSRVSNGLIYPKFKFDLSKFNKEFIY